MIHQRRLISGRIIASREGTLVRLFIGMADLVQPQLGSSGRSEAASWEVAWERTLTNVNATVIREIFKENRGEGAPREHAAKAASRWMLLEVLFHFFCSLTNKIAKRIATAKGARRGFWFVLFDGRNNYIVSGKRRILPKCRTLAPL